MRNHKNLRDIGDVDMPSRDSDVREDFAVSRLPHAIIATDQRPISMAGWVVSVSIGAIIWIALFAFAF